ncbi:MAG: ASCH domain-containing protein [bacterium]|nr:ASCH domain-containing protein [bacterium]
MKTLKFRHNLVKKILDRSKTVTWRLFDDKDLQIGDKIELIDWESSEKFAEAEITGVREKKLGEIEEKDFEGHEKYQSNEEMLEHYKKYYGEKVDMDTVVKIIDFKLLRGNQ